MEVFLPAAVMHFDVNSTQNSLSVRILSEVLGL